MTLFGLRLTVKTMHAKYIRNKKFRTHIKCTLNTVCICSNLGCIVLWNPCDGVRIQTWFVEKLSPSLVRPNITGRQLWSSYSITSSPLKVRVAVRWVSSVTVFRDMQGFLFFRSTAERRGNVQACMCPGLRNTWQESTCWTCTHVLMQTAFLVKIISYII